MMDTEKTITFGIWGEMGVRSSVKANIMSVKINDFPLPPIRRAACVALSFYILRPRDVFCLFSSCFCFWAAVGCVCPVFSGSFTFLVASFVLPWLLTATCVLCSSATAITFFCQFPASCQDSTCKNVGGSVPCPCERMR